MCLATAFPASESTAYTSCCSCAKALAKVEPRAPREVPPDSNTAGSREDSAEVASVTATLGFDPLKLLSIWLRRQEEQEEQDLIAARADEEE